MNEDGYSIRKNGLIYTVIKKERPRISVKIDMKGSTPEFRQIIMIDAGCPAVMICETLMYIDQIVRDNKITALNRRLKHKKIID